MSSDSVPDSFTYTPIGYVKSVFETKNGTPRQSGLSPLARATVRLGKGHFTNPEHALLDLAQFSHVWLLWVFHQNKEADTGRIRLLQQTLHMIVRNAKCKCNAALPMLHCIVSLINNGEWGEQAIIIRV